MADQLDVEPAGLTPRARRGIALIAGALVVMAGGVVAYLWSTVPRPYSGPPPPDAGRHWRSAAPPDLG